MGAVAEGRGLIGDVVTISIGRETSIREITVEVRDIEQAERIAGLVDGLDGVRVLWYQDRALIRHEGGKLQIDAIRRVATVQEMRDVYTPGVARVCVAIAEQPELAGRYTMISRSVAICTNGTRVLGLGNIGPVASMPVMEGKAVFYHQFAGISAMPVLIDTGNVDEFVETVVRIAPTFGGIHLEDISAPECFEIERRLIEALPQPVMHDDVHGTAVVSVAAAIVACRHAGIELRSATIGQLGLGAAGFGIAALMVDVGCGRVLAFDPQEASHPRARQKGIEIVSMEDVTSEADAGAAFAGDGRSVNNVLRYPGIFRGALRAGAREIDVEMKLAAAMAIADMAEGDELVPDALDQRVHDAVANAVQEAAERSGAARPELAAIGL
jgi:malate dehydrogenase (oxaloacetate-decarboxylating)